MYYQSNALNSHSSHSSPEGLPQQYYQMNGNFQQMPNSSVNPSMYGQQPNPYSPQLGAPNQSMSSPPMPKSSGPLNQTYPQMSSTLPPQRPPQQLTQTSLGPEVRGQAISSLSQQMSDISLSGPQQMHASNGPQSPPSLQTQQPMTSMTGQTYSLNQMASNAQSGGVPPPAMPSMQPPIQQRPTLSNDSMGQQSWSRPQIPGPPSMSTSMNQENWSSSSVQSNVSSVRPQTQPPLQANRFPQPYTGAPQQPLPQKMGQSMPPMGQPLASHMSGPPPGQMPGPPQMSNRYPPPPNMGSQMPPQMGPQSGPPPQGMPPRYDPNSGMAAQQQQPYHQQTQQRLDPEAMPSVVQVIEEDKLKFDGNDDVLYTTSIPASVPPLVTTITDNENRVTHDGGCARPQHIRSTVYQVPVSEDTLKITNIPLAIVVQPFDDSEVDQKDVSFGKFFVFVL